VASQEGLNPISERVETAVLAFCASNAGCVAPSHIRIFRGAVSSIAVLCI
jgi:hypothetical protein